MLKWWGFLLYPIVVADVLFSGAKPYKLNQKTKKWERDTSGKIKAYFKMRSHNMFIVKLMVTWINSKSGYYKTWGNIFTIYHGKEHELVRLVKAQEGHCLSGRGE